MPNVALITPIPSPTKSRSRMIIIVARGEWRNPQRRRAASCGVHHNVFGAGGNRSSRNPVSWRNRVSEASFDTRRPSGYFGIRILLHPRRGGAVMSRFHVGCLTILLTASPALAQPDKKSKLDDAQVRKLLMSLAPVPLPHNKPIDAITFTPDGNTVVSVSNRAGKVFRWEASSGRLLREWGMPQGTFHTSALSADGSVL